jgi:hypothetical protein
MKRSINHPFDFIAGRGLISGLLFQGTARLQIRKILDIFENYMEFIKITLKHAHYHEKEIQMHGLRIRP